MAISTIGSDGLASSSVGSTQLASSSVTRAKIGYAGAVLQVVNATYSTETTTTSSTFVDVGLSASITPTASTSKILVMLSSNGLSNNAGNTGLSIQVLRGASVIFTTDIGAAYQTADNDSAGSSGNYLDSPATTSSTTYKVQFKRYTGAGTSKINHYGTTSFLTLLEIAG